MITTGVLGGRWRASVTPWGAVEPWATGPGEQAGGTFDWAIAADDRWHVPATEAAVRQQRMEGTAVVETRVRIPDGDAVQRVYSVADHGGLTVVEVENASPLPIAVAFTRADILSVMAPSAPIEGITLPPGSVAFPVGHRATLTVALRHHDPAPGRLPSLPPVAGVVRGWATVVERASRLLLPDDTLASRVMAERCEMALAGPPHPDDDAAGFVLGVGELVRMGEVADPWLPDLARALEDVGRNGPHDWAFAAALDAAERVFAGLGERRARQDVASLRAASSTEPHAVPLFAPADGPRLVAWAEAQLARGPLLVPAGLPPTWVGANFEVYGVPTGPTSAVSFAVRWHGARPALLWEQQGDVRELSAPAVAPGWSTTDVKGETLWPAPPSGIAVAEGGSFS